MAAHTRTRTRRAVRCTKHAFAPSARIRPRSDTAGDVTLPGQGHDRARAHSEHASGTSGAGNDPVNASDPSGLSKCRHPTSIWDTIGSVMDCLSKGDVGGALSTVTTSALRTGATGIANSPDGQALSVLSQTTGVSWGGCVGGSAYAGVGVAEAICYYATPSGQSGFTVEGGAGGGGPFGANLLIGPSVSNAQNLSDLGGWFAYGGGSVGEGPYSAGVQGQIGQNSCGNTIWSATAGWAPSLDVPAPFSFEGGGSYTSTYSQW